MSREWFTPDDSGWKQKLSYRRLFYSYFFFFRDSPVEQGAPL
jgi:hypothetical protein